VRIIVLLTPYYYKGATLLYFLSIERDMYRPFLLLKLFDALGALFLVGSSFSLLFTANYISNSATKVNEMLGIIVATLAIYVNLFYKILKPPTGYRTLFYSD